MKYILLMLICALPMVMLAQQSPDDLINKFFAEYASLGAHEALDNLYATNSWTSENQEAIDNVKNKLSGIGEIVGDYHGHELIIEKSAGESFVLYSYLVKYDRQPIRFVFQFYRPLDTWKVFSFSFDENIDDELEEAASLAKGRNN